MTFRLSEKRQEIFTSFNTWIITADFSILPKRLLTKTKALAATYLTSLPDKQEKLLFFNSYSLRLHNDSLMLMRAFRSRCFEYEHKVELTPHSWLVLSNWAEDIWFLDKKRFILWSQNDALEFSLDNTNINEFCRNKKVD